MTAEGFSAYVGEEKVVDDARADDAVDDGAGVAPGMSFSTRTGADDVPAGISEGTPITDTVAVSELVADAASSTIACLFGIPLPYPIIGAGS